MNDKPTDCPTPRQCPVESREFIERLKQIEDEQRASKEARHELNASICRIMDEERIARLEIERSVQTIADRVDRLLTLMEGSFGRKGMVAQQDNIDSRVHALEEWKSQQKAFIAGVAAVGSLIGGTIVALFQFGWHYFR